MSSHLELGCPDLTALVQRGLGERVNEVECSLADGEVRLVLTGLNVSRWLPRLRVELAVTPSLRVESQELCLHWRVVPSSLTGILAGPAQQLGVGQQIVDGLVDRLGWSGALVSRDNETAVLALQRLASLQRLGIHLESVAIALSVQVEFSLRNAE